uniref:MARVEL domain-containing protein n=2 Tax=Leptobrachium leishanense TaxID=445787 RepID=A0A8C5R799_9ANUR
VYGGGALLTQEISRVPQIMSAMQLNLSPLKEPLGFIKVLEWISSICSFATCGGYHGTTQMIVSCVNSTVHSGNKTTEASFAYPFRLPSATFEEIDDNLCGGKWEELHLTGDYSSPAQFYVTVAVFAFLYCIGALVLYLGFKQLYQTNSKLPLIDFILTVIFTFLWLVSSSAWAKGLTDVKTATDPVNSAVNCLIPFKCVGGIGPHLKSLNISVVGVLPDYTEHGTDNIPPALSK